MARHMDVWNKKFVQLFSLMLGLVVTLILLAFAPAAWLGLPISTLHSHYDLLPYPLTLISTYYACRLRETTMKPGPAAAIAIP